MASAATAATVGVSSLASCRSTSTPDSGVGAGDGHPVGAGLDRAARLGQHGQDLGAGLGRRRGPARDGDPATGDRGRGEEDRGVGEVGLDGPVARPDGARGDPPGVGLRVVDVDPGLAEHRDRHVDVRQRRHRLAVVVHGDALVVARAGEQQAGHELGRRRRVDHHVAARDPAGAVQGERQAVAVDAGAERAQGVEHGGQGAFAGAGVAVEGDRAVGERRGGWHEPHDGAREPAVDGAAAAQAVVQRRWRGVRRGPRPARRGRAGRRP